MAKVGKLTKLKSAIKRWPSFTKTHHHSSAAAAAASEDVSAADDLPKGDLRVVYVGKCRRAYMLSSDIIGHPLFQELVDRSSRFAEHDRSEIVVACEVVLFEHMLWMLKNSTTSSRGGFGGGGSMEELAEFYTY